MKGEIAILLYSIITIRNNTVGHKSMIYPVKFPFYILILRKSS